MSSRALGKGLGALLPEEPNSAQNSASMLVPISQIEPSPLQPRKFFDEDALNSLSESIRLHGLLQPLAVRKIDSDKYQIIAGERRWRAAQLAELTELPVIVIESDDRHAMELALIENLQREDLNPIEEAQGYKFLIEVYGLTQEDTATRVGKSRPAVTNSLRLLTLPDPIQDCLISGILTSGHARVLLQLDGDEMRLKAAERILKESLSVRQSERLVKRLMEESSRKEQIGKLRTEYIEETETKLSSHLGRRVKITPGKNKGRFEIEFYGADDMELLISLLSKLENSR